MKKLSAAIVLLTLVLLAAVCYHPPWMSEDWCSRQAQEKLYGDFKGTQFALFGLERFYVGEYVSFGRRVGVTGPPDAIGGWWMGWMDLFGNTHVEYVS